MRIKIVNKVYMKEYLFLVILFFKELLNFWKFRDIDNVFYVNEFYIN